MSQPTTTKTNEMSYDQRYAALELTDKLYSFAEAYGLSDDWVQETAEEARQAALTSTGIDTQDA